MKDIDFREIDSQEYYSVYIVLKYSIDGRSREAFKIERIKGYSLHTLLTYGIPVDDIAEISFNLLKKE